MLDRTEMLLMLVDSIFEKENYRLVDLAQELMGYEIVECSDSPDNFEGEDFAIYDSACTKYWLERLLERMKAT